MERTLYMGGHTMSDIYNPYSGKYIGEQEPNYMQLFAQIGLTKDQMDEAVRQFNITTSMERKKLVVQKSQFTKTFGLQEEQFAETKKATERIITALDDIGNEEDPQLTQLLTEITDLRTQFENMGKQPKPDNESSAIDPLHKNIIDANTSDKAIDVLKKENPTMYQWPPTDIKSALPYLHAAVQNVPIGIATLLYELQHLPPLFSPKQQSTGRSF